eukprot:8386438-Lingulodinium_polyedra.AAC.1
MPPSALARKLPSGARPLVAGILARAPCGSIQPDAVSCTAAIRACEEAAQWRSAGGLLARMPRAGRRPASVSYNAVIGSWGQAAPWRSALGHLACMPCATLRPGGVSCNMAVSACAGGAWGSWAARPTRACSLTPPATTLPSAPVIRPLMTLGSLAPGVHAPCRPAARHLAIGRQAAGWQAFRWLAVRHRQLQCRHQRLRKAAQWRSALGLLLRFARAGLRPNTVSYSAAISACKRANEWRLQPPLTLGSLAPGAHAPCRPAARHRQLQRCRQRSREGLPVAIGPQAAGWQASRCLA